MKVKVFWITKHREIENKVNKWFSENKDIEIFEIRNSDDEDWSMVYIYYEEGKKDGIGFK